MRKPARTCANQQDSLSNEEYFHCRNRSARVRCIVTRRSDREAEGARLLSEYAPKGHLGFESPALRQYEFEEGPHLGPFFIIKNGGWGFEPERARALSKRESVCSPWAKSRQALKPEGMRSMPGHPQLSASMT